MTLRGFRRCRVRAALWAALTLVPCFGQSGRHAVLIDIDGVRADTFQQLYEQGRLPAFRRVFNQALWFENAFTVAPSVTMAAQASIFTGAFPSRHGVMGNQWFDRGTSRLIDYITVSGIACVYGVALFASGCGGGLANSHLLSPTLYEAAKAAGFTSLVVYGQYWKGATEPAPPTIPEALQFLSGEPIDYRVFDSAMSSRAISELHAHGLPSILTLYFAGADGVAHQQGIAGGADYAADVIDPLLVRILDTIEALDPAWRSSTLVILTSDHGRTDASAFPGDVFLRQDLASALGRAGYPPDRAAIAENGGMAYIYLNAGGSPGGAPDAAALEAVAAALLQDPVLSPLASVRPRTADDGARSGDLIVILQPGHYFGNTGAGSHHGGTTRGDLNVPLVLAVPGHPGGRLTVQASVTQIARTIADWLGFAMETAAPPLPITAGKRTASCCALPQVR